MKKFLKKETYILVLWIIAWIVFLFSIVGIFRFLGHVSEWCGKGGSGDFGFGCFFSFLWLIIMSVISLMMWFIFLPPIRKKAETIRNKEEYIISVLIILLIIVLFIAFLMYLNLEPATTHKLWLELYELFY